MKKINLNGIAQILSEKELKNVMGGSSTDHCKNKPSCNGTTKCPSNKICIDYGIGSGKCCI